MVLHCFKRKGYLLSREFGQHTLNAQVKYILSPPTHTVLNSKNHSKSISCRKKGERKKRRLMQIKIVITYQQTLAILTVYFETTQSYANYAS